MLALIAGVIAIITGALCFLPPIEMGLYLTVFVVLTAISGITATALGNRAWSSDRQTIALVGFILGFIGFLAMFAAVLIAFFSTR